MKHKWNLRKFLVMAVFVLGVLAAGCSAPQSSESAQILETVVSVIEPTESDEMQVEAADTSGGDSQQEPTSLPTAEVGEADSPAPTVADGSGGDASPSPVAEQRTPPALKTALEATNPSTVALGAGKPQLIEFFAFW